MPVRKRSANWHLTERLLLLDLVSDHYNIVGNKKTDGVSMKQKQEEWSKISDEFNFQTNGYHRTAENLKSQWESLKKSSKKASSARQKLTQEGEVPPPQPLDNDPVYNKVMHLVSTPVVDFLNKLDSGMDKNHSQNGCSQENLHDPLEKLDNTVSLEKLDNTVSSHAFVALESQDTDSSQDSGDYKPEILQTSPCCEKDTGACSSEEECSTSKPNRRESSQRMPAAFEELRKRKLMALEMQMNFARIEREEARKIFETNLEIRKEILKQEKLKTRLLLEQLRNANREKKY